MCGKNTPSNAAPMLSQAVAVAAPAAVVDTIADRKVAAESATGFKLQETVATFDGIKVVVGFGRVNFPGSSEPARVLLLADLSDLAANGVQAVAPYDPINVHKLADHPANSN